MDLPSAALGALWLLMVEVIGGLLFYLWHQATPIDRSKDAAQLAKKKLNTRRTT